MQANRNGSPMSELCTMHASFVLWRNKGILFRGKSGSGKSELALKFIENKNAVLVADDVVELKVRQNKLWGSSPQNIRGLLEIRNVGISRYEYAKEAAVSLLVNLLPAKENLERLPKNKTENILGVEIPAIDLYAEDTTILEKIIVKLRDNLLKTE
ncbi:MAG: HPr kinase/phosphorylase [Alphaproteobacteria bacterium]